MTLNELAQKLFETIQQGVSPVKFGDITVGQSQSRFGQKPTITPTPMPYGMYGLHDPANNAISINPDTVNTWPKWDSIVGHEMMHDMLSYLSGKALTEGAQAQGPGRVELADRIAARAGLNTFGNPWERGPYFLQETTTAPIPKLAKEEMLKVLINASLAGGNRQAADYLKHRIRRSSLLDKLGAPQ